MACANNVPEKTDNNFPQKLAKTHFEASNLLKNGILVETSKGLVCLSLSDALSSNLNLSEDDLQQLATELILQENLTSEGMKTSQINSDFCSTDTTADSDDPASDFGEKHQCEHNFSNFPQPSTSSDSDALISDQANRIMINCITKNRIENVAKNSLKVEQKTTLISAESNEGAKVATKRKGGWPKGRKRKPEVLHLPPKAPATGYTIYLNEMRKNFKDSSLAFYEITKILGNKWSSLNLKEKKPYLDRAEEGKKRYKEELRLYRQSGAYQLYLAKKRKKKVQNNILSESDMDATDDIDDEDNEELYCRTCDQWFHSLHNKKEHLQGRQHVQVVAGHIRALEIDPQNEDILVTTLEEKKDLKKNKETFSETISDVMKNLMKIIEKRNVEIKVLKAKIAEIEQKNVSLNQELTELKKKENQLTEELNSEKEKQKEIESQMLYLLGMNFLDS